MNNEQRVRNIIEQFKSIGFDVHTIPFDKSKMGNIFPSTEILEYITFSGMGALVWAITRDIFNGETYYYNTYKDAKSRKVFSSEMLGAIADELERQYAETMEIVYELMDCDDDKVMDIALEKVVKPYMAERLKVWKEVRSADAKRIVVNYSIKPSVSIGKRGCDTGSNPYKALVIGEGYQYIGGMVIGKNYIKYFAPLCGETSYTFDPKCIVAHIRLAVTWICQ